METAADALGKTDFSAIDWPHRQYGEKTGRENGDILVFREEVAGQRHFGAT